MWSGFGSSSSWHTLMLHVRGMFLSLAGGRGEKRLMLMAMRVLGGRGAACSVAQMMSPSILLVGLAPLTTLWCVARVPNFWLWTASRQRRICHLRVPHRRLRKWPYSGPRSRSTSRSTSRSSDYLGQDQSTRGQGCPDRDHHCASSATSSRSSCRSPHAPHRRGQSPIVEQLETDASAARGTRERVQWLARV